MLLLCAASTNGQPWLLPFIIFHLPEPEPHSLLPTCQSKSWAIESQSLSGKQKITVIERHGKQVSNWYWPGMTHRPLAFLCHFKLVSDLQNRKATPLQLCCHSLMANADGWAERYRGLQKAHRSLRCDHWKQYCHAGSSDRNALDELFDVPRHDCYCFNLFYSNRQTKYLVRNNKGNKKHCDISEVSFKQFCTIMELLGFWRSQVKLPLIPVKESQKDTKHKNRPYLDVYVPYIFVMCIKMNWPIYHAINSVLKNANIS